MRRDIDFVVVGDHSRPAVTEHLNELIVGITGKFAYTGVFAFLLLALMKFQAGLSESRGLQETVWVFLVPFGPPLGPFTNSSNAVARHWFNAKEIVLCETLYIVCCIVAHYCVLH